MITNYFENSASQKLQHEGIGSGIQQTQKVLSMARNWHITWGQLGMRETTQPRCHPLFTWLQKMPPHHADGWSGKEFSLPHPLFPHVNLPQHEQGPLFKVQETVHWTQATALKSMWLHLSYLNFEPLNFVVCSFHPQYIHMCVHMSSLTGRI